MENSYFDEGNISQAKYIILFVCLFEISFLGRQTAVDVCGNKINTLMFNEIQYKLQRK